jgi:aminopeptidase N
MVLEKFEQAPFGQAKFNMLQNVAEFLGKTKSPEMTKRGVDAIVKFRDAVPESFKDQTDPFINGVILKGLVNRKNEAGLKDQAEYIKTKLPEADKKGF